MAKLIRTATTRRSDQDRPGPASGRGVGSVLVSYEPSTNGRAALSYALALAGQRGAPLTIAAVAPQDRTDVGCAHCRATTARWNEQMRLVARERLSELSAHLEDPPTSVRYLAACGPTAGVLAQAAEHYAIDMIVLSWRPAERVRRLLRVSVPEQLGRQRRWEIVVAPRAAKFARREVMTGTGRDAGCVAHSSSVRGSASRLG